MESPAYCCAWIGQRFSVSSFGLPLRSLAGWRSKTYACFGEMALIEECSERSASGGAVVTCKVTAIRRDQFVRLADSDPEIGNVVFSNRMISERLKKANKDILKLTPAFLFAVDS